jgi:hypothetical protein
MWVVDAARAPPAIRSVRPSLTAHAITEEIFDDA